MARAIMCGVELPPKGLPEITDQFNHRQDFYFEPIHNTNKWTNSRPSDSPYRSIFGMIFPGSRNRYRVVCTPAMPDVLWYNFSFHDFASGLVVTANDESIGQYVTRVNDRTFDIMSAGVVMVCELCINYVAADGIKIYELEE